MKWFKVLLISLLTFSVALAQTEGLENATNTSDRISSMSASDYNLVVSLNAGQTGQIIVLSVKECSEMKRFIYNENVSSVEVSTLDFSSLWAAQGKSLIKINLSDGVETYANNILDDDIKGIRQSKNGVYIAVWSSSRLMVLNIKEKEVKPVWVEATPFDISDVLIDTKNGFTYISGSDGALLKRSNSGSIVNSFDLGYSINAMDIDEDTQTLFLAMSNGVLKVDIENTVFTRINALPTDDIKISSDGRTIAIIGNDIYSNYSYPAIKLIGTYTLKGSKLYLLPNNSAVSYSGNILNFYDNVKQKIAGTVYIFENSVGFTSPEKQYYGNEFFRKAIASNRVKGFLPYIANDREPNKDKACKGFIEMFTSVYTPEKPKTEKPSVDKPINVETPKVDGAVKPDKPVIKDSSSIETVAETQKPVTPTLENNINKPNVSGVEASDGIKMPDKPIINVVLPPSIAPGADIPMWVIRPSSLPTYSAVKSGGDTAKALKDAKIKIREDVARNTMKEMLETQLVKDIKNEELKKRLLWMVAGKTAQISMEYVMQKNLWVSPEGVFYVLAQVDEQSIYQIFEPIFKEEMNQLSTYGPEEYMKRDPVKWD